MLSVWYDRRGELLYLDGDHGGAGSERHADSEAEWIFRELWYGYEAEYRRIRRERDREQRNHHGRLRFRGGENTVFLRDCYDVQGRLLPGSGYHRDFFSQYCFILAVRRPEDPFEGTLHCQWSDSGWGTQQIHVVYDGNTLTFELQEGQPVYTEEIVRWTRTDGEFVKKRIHVR